uniref:Uncharacterized protein n=1 Tax=Rhizophora mucronata TaxID=61149 RepID=A0A2P2PIC1_RHIMU
MVAIASFVQTCYKRFCVLLGLQQLTFICRVFNGQ